jgi:RNA 2',3'-cyclic 3'-phosphodiesterase
MDNEEIRTFIAIEFPIELKNKLREFQGGLKTPQQSFIKWVDPDLMHLTLKFLGNQSMKKIDVIKKVLEVSAASCKPFYLNVGQPGCFPSLKNIRIYWIGLEGNIDQLASLQKHIEELLAVEGFPRDTRPFAAHLTLARLKDECTMQNRSSFAAAIQNVRFDQGHRFPVEHIVLMKSTLTPMGPHYTRLASYKLIA